MSRVWPPHTAQTLLPPKVVLVPPSPAATENLLLPSLRFALHTANRRRGFEKKKEDGRAKQREHSNGS